MKTSDIIQYLPIMSTLTNGELRFTTFYWTKILEGSQKCFTSVLLIDVSRYPQMLYNGPYSFPLCCVMVCKRRLVESLLLHKIQKIHGKILFVP